MATAPVPTPWELTPEYLTLTQRVGPPGGATAYAIPHPAGTSANDITTFVYGQATITLDNWPNIMYVLEPDQAWKDFQKTRLPAAKKDHNDWRMMERFPRAGSLARPLLDFPVLPDNISSTEDWWWFDLWRRVDPRIRWEDITMRIKQPQRTKESDKKLQNAIQTMAGRKWHAKYFMLSWFPKGGSRNAQGKTNVLNALQAAGIPRQLNTTRGLTPGFVDPLQSAGKKIPHPIMTGVRRGPRPSGRGTRKIVAVESDEEDEDIDVEESDTGEVENIYYESDGSEESEKKTEDEDEEEDDDVEQRSPTPYVTAKNNKADSANCRRRSPSTPTPGRPHKVQKAQRHPSVGQAAQKVEQYKHVYLEEFEDGNGDLWMEFNHPGLAYSQHFEDPRREMGPSMPEHKAWHHEKLVLRNQGLSKRQSNGPRQPSTSATHNYYGPTIHHHHYGSRAPGYDGHQSNYYGTATHHYHASQASNPPPPEPSWLKDIDDYDLPMGTINPRTLHFHH